MHTTYRGAYFRGVHPSTTQMDISPLDSPPPLDAAQMDAPPPPG